MKRPWDPEDTPDDASNDRAYEEYRRYREMNRRHHRRVRRQRFMRWFGWTGLAIAACAVVWAFMTFNPPTVQVWRGGPFRNCAEARAAGAAPIRIGQPDYAPHLDADRDGIACELSFWQWIEKWWRSFWQWIERWWR